MASNEVSLERMILVLRMRAGLILVVFMAAVLLAGLVTYLTPKMYTATSTLNFAFKGNPVDNIGTAVLAENSYISTQIGIIESLRVAQVVVENLTEYEMERLIAALEAKRSALDDLKRLFKSPIRWVFSGKKNGKNSPNEVRSGQILTVGSQYHWLARVIGGDLSAEPIFNSRIVRVSYSSTNQKIAALMANKYSEAYITTNLQMITDPASKSEAWFDEQLTSLRKRLEDTQSRLTEYQQLEGIVSSDERLDTETSRLRDLSSQLLEAQQATRNADTERQKLQEVLSTGASLITFEPILQNSIVQNIKSEIRVLEGEIVQNSSSLGPNHPQMKKLNSELSAMRGRLNKEISAISDGINNATELSKEREKDLGKALREQKQLVLGLKNQHDRIAVLQRKVESAQATYNAALNQLNTTSMQSMVDQTNVSIIDTATIPTSHSSPRVMINLALGVIAGLLLGIGITVFMEVFSRRVYSREDLLTELDVPLLGHLKKV